MLYSGTKLPEYTIITEIENKVQMGDLFTFTSKFSIPSTKKGLPTWENSLRMRLSRVSEERGH